VKGYLLILSWQTKSYRFLKF